MNTAAYNNWVFQTEPDAERLSFKREMLGTFAYLPEISVLMVTSDPDEVWIKRSISSVLEQIYPHFELCVYDNASSRPHVAESLAEFAASQECVKTSHLKESTSWAEAYNRALSLATGEFVVLMEVGDELSPDAMFSVVDFLQSVEADVVYADEDSVDISDRRSDPVFKPYWSPDLLVYTPYIGRPCVIRRGLVERSGRFREGFEGAEEYELMLRLSEETERIRHLPRILYHRRTYGGEPAKSGEDRRSQRRAAEDALRLQRRLEETSVDVVGPYSASGAPRWDRSVSDQPSVSVVAFVQDERTAGNVEDLATRSSYSVHEILVTGPGDPTPREKLSDDASPAEMVNLAAGRATGEYLLFLRNYEGAGSPGWISELLLQAQRAETGAVGGKVLNSDGTWSAGGYPNLSGLTGESTNMSIREIQVPFLPIVDYPFNPCAVPLECMMVRRSTFEEIGGFDESLPTVYDLDFSFRLVERGLLNVYVPEVSVFAAGASPPPDEEEIAYMWRRWWAMLARELYYRESPLDAGYRMFEDELPLFLRVQSGGRVTK